MLSFMTPSAAVLLKAFDEAVAKGHVTTWEKSNGYYGHKADRWAHKAFFKSTVRADRLEFELTLVEGNIKPYEHRSVYSYYHGHLIETFQNHFYFRFDSVVATAAPAGGESKVA